jgi:hypothetical protein
LTLREILRTATPFANVFFVYEAEIKNGFIDTLGKLDGDVIAEIRAKLRKMRSEETCITTSTLQQYFFSTSSTVYLLFTCLLACLLLATNI